MPHSNIHDPKHWRDRAAEMRALAETMKDAETIAIMNRRADDHDKLADRAAIRSSSGVQKRAQAVLSECGYTWPGRA